MPQDQNQSGGPGTVSSALLSVVPSLIVLATAALVLMAGPTAVRTITHAQTEARIIHAAGRLQDGNILEHFSEACRDVALVVEPSVVHIRTKSRVSDSRGAVAELTSSGSGWVYDDDGHIISNAHVVDGADQIMVQLHTGDPLEAELVARDLRTDIAVLRVRRGHLHPARRGTSDGVRQGDLVFTFGSPFDFPFSMSSGIVSGLGRSTGQQDIFYENYIQVDAAINPGNSGGPLTDARGRVIGMNTAIATARNTPSGQGQFAGIGLAIPVAMIESVADKLIRNGEADRGYMGVSVSMLTETLARAVNYGGAGFVVNDVIGDGPADRAGLRRGDVITHIDGRELTNRDRIPIIIATRAPGDRIVARIWRPLPNSENGFPLELEIELDRYDPALRSPRISLALQRFGMANLETSTNRRTAELGVPFVRGVLVPTVRADTEAARLIEPGSVIVAVNDLPVTSVDDLYVRAERLLGSDAPLIGSFASSAMVVTFQTPAGGVRRLRLVF